MNSDTRKYILSPSGFKPVLARCQENRKNQLEDEQKETSTDPFKVFAKFLEGSCNTHMHLKICLLLIQKPPQLTSEQKFIAGIVPLVEESGGQPHREEHDQRFHQAYSYPWPSDRSPYHSHVTTTDPNHHILTTALPAEGYRTSPRFESEWEKYLAYHHGLYHPAAFMPAKTLNEIKHDVNDFALKVHQDNPKDACKYLLLEEQKCLCQQHYEMDPQQASQKCLKWFTEWRQCKWDEEKLKRGYNYIEAREEQKHRPAYTAPNFRFS